MIHIYNLYKLIQWLFCKVVCNMSCNWKPYLVWLLLCSIITYS